MKRIALILMIALLPLAGCDKFDNNSSSGGRAPGGQDSQGGQPGGGEGGGDDKPVAQPSGAIKEWTQDLWVDRTLSPGMYQYMVSKYQVTYDSKGRIARIDESDTYYKEGGGQDGDVRHSSIYYVYGNGTLELRFPSNSEKDTKSRCVLNSDGNVVTIENGYMDGSSWKVSGTTKYSYQSLGSDTKEIYLSKVEYPVSSGKRYPFEFTWSSNTTVSRIVESDPRSMQDPEEDETRNYFYTEKDNPLFGSPLDLATYAVVSSVIGGGYPLPLGSGIKKLVSYANTTYRNEAEKFTWEWNSGNTRLEHIRIDQKLFPEDSSVKNSRQINYWPEYYD